MHRNRSIPARWGLSIAAALLCACSSNEDVVARVVPSFPSVGSVVVNGGATTVGIAGGMSAGPPPIAASMTLPTGAGVPAPPGTLLVSGAPRAIHSDDAERWPFPSPLRDVFATPAPNQTIWYRVLDPAVAEVLRQLGSSHGFAPGGAATFVVDDLVDQYDVSLLELE